MSDPQSRYPAWLLPAVLAFIGGMLVYGVVLDTRETELEASRAAGFEEGYARALAESPTLDVEEKVIHIISSAVFMDNMEVDVKAIARTSNAIDFTYGEKGGKRSHEPALRVGDAIAERLGNNLYVIKNVSVSANLQRATIEVTRIGLPDPQQP